jgi:transcription-repair coupling factor (superfamily II helicase)
MRDLEMRGAGDILGMRQHGQIAAVGFHLYTQLLGNAVRRLKRDSTVKGLPLAATTGDGQGDLEALMSAAVSVDLPIAASIPASYIADQDLRLRVYRRVADIHDESKLAEVAQELADRFGPLPPTVENLLFQLRVRILATRAGVTAVGSENGQLVLTTQPTDEVNQAFLGTKLGPGARTSKNRIWLGKAASVRGQGETWRDTLLTVLRQLGELNPAE